MEMFQTCLVGALQLGEWSSHPHNMAKISGCHTQATCTHVHTSFPAHRNEAYQAITKASIWCDPTSFLFCHGEAQLCTNAPPLLEQHPLVLI